jgi:hypothetical protein
MHTQALHTHEKRIDGLTFDMNYAMERICKLTERVVELADA